MQPLVVPVPVPVTEAVLWNNTLVADAPRTEHGLMVLRNIYAARRLASELHAFHDELEDDDRELLKLLDREIAKSPATEWFGEPTTPLQRRIVRAVARQRAVNVKAAKGERANGAVTKTSTCSATPRERRPRGSTKSSSRGSPREDDDPPPLTRLQSEAAFRDQLARAVLAARNALQPALRHCPRCDRDLELDYFSPSGRWCRPCKASDQASRRLKVAA